jgi:hypothetical protein
MSKRLKLMYLLLLSLLSVFFAEVISGSMMFPLFDLWGYIVVIPLYGLHTILLLKLVSINLKNRRVLFATLYLAGTLFGMYEAYITKVLFVGLTPDSVMLFQVPIIDFIVLVFFWHPIFSFIIPVLIFERLVTKSNYIYEGLPNRWKTILSKKYSIILFSIIVGFYSAFNGQLDTLFLSIISLGLPILIIFLFLYKKEKTQIYSFEEILPKKKGTIFGIVYLGLIYFGEGVLFKSEVLTLSNQVSIWISYIILGSLFYIAIIKNKRLPHEILEHKVINITSILIHSIIISISGTIFVLVFYFLGIRDIVVITIWISWIVIGIYIFIYSIISKKV